MITWDNSWMLLLFLFTWEVTVHAVFLFILVLLLLFAIFIGGMTATSSSIRGSSYFENEIVVSLLGNETTLATIFSVLLDFIVNVDHKSIVSVTQHACTGHLSRWCTDIVRFWQCNSNAIWLWHSPKFQKKMKIFNWIDSKYTENQKYF